MSVPAWAPHTLPHSRPPEIQSTNFSNNPISILRSYPIPSGYSDLILLNTAVSNILITAMIDSGSSVSTLRFDLVQELNLHISPYTDVPVTAFNGGPVPIMGQVTTTIRFNSAFLEHTFLVVQHSAI